MSVDPRVTADGGPNRLVDWFTRPGPERAGLLNLSYNALDRHVVRGLADEPALLFPFAPAGARSHYSYSGLLEQASQLAGGMRELGVRPGRPVLLVLPVVPELVVSVLACARLGAVAVPVDVDTFDADPAAATRDLAGGPPALTLTDGPRKAALHGALAAADRSAQFAVVLRPVPDSLDQTGDVDFAALMRPGQFEAGVCAELAPDAPFLTVPEGTGARTYDHGWTVALAAEARDRGLGPGSFADAADPGTDRWAALLGPLVVGAAVELR